jgi:hypothetical protein
MLSLQHREKLSLSHLGSLNGMWKGNNATPTAARARARRMYPCQPGFERHHKDGNPFNNVSENIEITTRKNHMLDDGRLSSRNSTTGKFTKKINNSSNFCLEIHSLWNGSFESGNQTSN